MNDRTTLVSPSTSAAPTAPLALSVILPTYNGGATIRRQLEALLAQDCPVGWEILVVDNGSTDSTAATVEDFIAVHPIMRRVVASETHNLSYARNAGVRAARGVSVAFCDDDDVVGPTWVKAMASALESHALVASRMVYEELNDPAALVGRARFQSTHIETMFGYPVVNGAGFGVQKWLWDQLGGNDEALWFTGEDFDFALRAHLVAGVTPVLAEGAEYHYRQRRGVRAAFRQGRRTGQGHAELYRRYGRGRIDRRAELRMALRDWWWSLTRAPLALGGRNRELWARRVGIRAGRLYGSWRARTWFP